MKAVLKYITFFLITGMVAQVTAQTHMGVPVSSQGVKTEKTIDATLEMSDIFEKKYQMKDFRGQWLIVNYWATWCPPCRDEIPMLVDYDSEHKNVQVFGINYEPGMDIEDLKEFVDTYFVSYPIILANRKIVDIFGHPKGLPMTVFVDPNGVIVEQYMGKLHRALLDRITQQNQ